MNNRLKENIPTEQAVLEPYEERRFTEIQLMYDQDLAERPVFIEAIRPIFEFKNHISCSAHKLQLVLKDVFEVDPAAIELRKVSIKSILIIILVGL